MAPLKMYRQVNIYNITFTCSVPFFKQTILSIIIYKYILFLLGCRPSVKERLGAAVTTPAKTEDNEYIPTRRSTEEQQVTQNLVPTSPKTTTVPTREEKVLAIKKTQEILAAKETLKKKQEEKRKEALKLTADLRKRKQELLDKHLIEIRALIEKAEKNPEQKDAIMATIKTMQQSIDNLRKDLAANGQIGGNKAQVKSREQTQKEILDAELDLMTAQQEGQDAGELQKRLNELRAQAAALGLNAGPAVSRGTRSSRVIRGAHAISYRGRGRGSFAHVSVDHRPTSLLVSGYETEEKAEVLAHFQVRISFYPFQLMKERSLIVLRTLCFSNLEK